MIVALDISTANTGMAFLRRGERTPSVYSIKPNKKYADYAKLIDIADQVKQKVKDAIFEDKELYVFAEQPFFISGKSYPGPMFISHGMILKTLNDLCVSWGIEFSWTEVPLSHWRPWLLKRTNVIAESRKSAEQKTATRIALLKLGYEYYEDDNMADALSLFVYVMEEIMKEEK